jgi:hypothetical protein
MSNRELITWRGTPGVGDFMWALNSAHHYAYFYNKKVVLEFQWEHDEDYLHHFEDPETIIERLEYLHNFYHRKDDVIVQHVFNAYGRYRDWSYWDDVIPDSREENAGRSRVIVNRGKKNRFWFESGVYGDGEGQSSPINDWSFRKLPRNIDKRKVVIWRPTFNAEVPRTWKNFLTFEQWEGIISTLRSAGLYVVELTYRTPIREVMYHLSTCRLTICYDGMWHYIAKNLQVPLVVISNEGITKYHTPYCLRLSPLIEEDNNIFQWLRPKNIPDLLGKPKHMAHAYYDERIKEIFDGDNE